MQKSPFMKKVYREASHPTRQASSQDLHVHDYMYMYMNKMLDYTRSNLYYAKISGCMFFDLSPLSSINNGTVKSIVFLLIQLVCEYFC